MLNHMQHGEQKMAINGLCPIDNRCCDKIDDFRMKLVKQQPSNSRQTQQ